MPTPASAPLDRAESKWDPIYTHEGKRRDPKSSSPPKRPNFRGSEARERERERKGLLLYPDVLHKRNEREDEDFSTA